MGLTELLKIKQAISPNQDYQQFFSKQQSRKIVRRKLKTAMQEKRRQSWTNAAALLERINTFKENMKDPAFKAEHDRNQRVAWLNARLSVLEWDFNFVKDQFRLKKMEQEYFEAKAELRTLGQTFPEDELVVSAQSQQSKSDQNVFLQADFKNNAKRLREVALDLKRLETFYKKDKKTGLDSVDCISILSDYAVKMSNNNPEVFIRLMNEVLIGDNINSPYTPNRILGNYRIEIGDFGMSNIYQDNTPYQMTHFWEYVFQGYDKPEWFAKIGNIIHEVIDPSFKSKFPWLYTKGTESDYRLGILGIKLGQSLRNGKVKLKDIPQVINSSLRNKKYDPVSSRNILLGPLRKNFE